MLCFSSNAQAFIYFVVSFFLNLSLKSGGVEGSSKVGLGGGGGGLVRGIVVFCERKQDEMTQQPQTRFKIVSWLTCSH